MGHAYPSKAQAYLMRRNLLGNAPGQNPVIDLPI